MSRRLNEKDTLEMYAYYCEGNSLVKTAEQFHYTAPAISLIFKSYGFKTRSVGTHSPKSNEHIRAEALRMYIDFKSGLTLQEVATKYRCKMGRVLYRIYCVAPSVAET